MPIRVIVPAKTLFYIQYPLIFNFRLDNLEEDRSKWNQFLEKALTTSPIDSRAFRAGVIWNPLRGLTFNPNPLHTNATSDGNLMNFPNLALKLWLDV